MYPLGQLPDILAGAVADVNIIQVGAGSSGSLSAALLAKSNCLKVLVLDDGANVNLYDPNAPFRPGNEYGPGGYFSGSYERMSTHVQNAGIDSEHNVHGSLWRTIPGGAMRLSHYAWETGDSRIHRREMYEALGRPAEWSPEHVWQVIADRRLNFSGPHITTNHANNGPLRIQESRDCEFQRTWLQGCSQITGNRIEYDFNTLNGSIKTCGAEPSNIRADGYRSITENEFLIPEASRNPNLILVRDVAVHRVLFDTRDDVPRAVGVEGTFRGQYFNVRLPERVSLPRGHSCRNIQKTKNYKKVLLSMGTIGNAHILKLSGVGPRAELESNGIKVIIENDNVGANLKEGMVSYLGYYTNATSAEVGVFPTSPDLITSRPGAFVEYQDNKYLFLLTPSVWAPDFVVAYALVFELETPLTGTVKLFSANPMHLPLVDYAWTDATVDKQARGLLYFRDIIVNSSIGDRFSFYQMFPADDISDIHTLKRSLKTAKMADPVGTKRAMMKAKRSGDPQVVRNAVTMGSEAILHATGTTRMALNKADGVVDTGFNVFDSENLMVGSVSVLRYFPGSGGQAWAVAVADILTEKILTQLELPMQ